ncbi:archaellum operon transcriptional activator EarA family protein [Pyrobaculum sp.]|uniref:archaellum operon transcriptional activator EarA family protein n=1 Tax=Pyrobaculum sp. TaxID=2004705 RepID=UPI003D0BFA1E
MALYRIAKAFRRSRVRFEIFKLLCQAREPMYPMMIARLLGTSYDNVLGALRGGRGYRREESLVALGLVKEITWGRQKLYQADEEHCRYIEEVENRLL